MIITTRVIIVLVAAVCAAAAITIIIFFLDRVHKTALVTITTRTSHKISTQRDVFILTVVALTPIW